MTLHGLFISGLICWILFEIGITVKPAPPKGKKDDKQKNGRDI